MDKDERIMDTSDISKLTETITPVIQHSEEVIQRTGPSTTALPMLNMNDTKILKTAPPSIQRSVAFDLADGLSVSSLRDQSEGEQQDTRDTRRRESRKEIIGILKPPNPRKELKSFPSLPECFLHDLGLLEKLGLDAGNLSERDIENKFSSLSLAFKTDRVSLQERHQLQLRQRDIAERNVGTEIRELATSVRSLGRVCHDSETREVLARVEKQIQVLTQSTGGSSVLCPLSSVLCPLSSVLKVESPPLLSSTVQYSRKPGWPPP